MSQVPNRSADTSGLNLPTRRDLLAAGATMALTVPVAGLANAECQARPAGTTKSPRLRRNVTKLGAAEKTDLVEAILKLKKVRSPFDMRFNYYDQFVAWHLLAQCCPRPEHPDTPWPSHYNPAIWPWHRILLHLFEKALEAVAGKPVSLPYWDWTDLKSLDVVFAEDFMGPKRGDPEQNYAVTKGPFRKGAWQLSVLSVPSGDPGQCPWLVRAFGINDEPGLAMPGANDLDGVMAVKDYDVAPFDITSDPKRSFRARLDGAYGMKGKACSADGIEIVVPGPSAKPVALHSGVHRYVAGLFKVGSRTCYGTLKTHASNNDPVFYLHHAFLDKIWADWMARHGRIYQPEKEIPKSDDMLVGIPGLHTPLPPFHRVAPHRCTVDSILDHTKLGYAYDTDRLVE
jgi:tyrosinase